jgi:transcriptional regulator with XRE-family HTH domain
VKKNLSSASHHLMDFLRQCREKSDLTQAEVAQKLGYTSPQFVSNWERGLECPPMKVLGRLAVLYSIDTEELFEILLSVYLETTETSLRKEYSQSRKRR